MEYHMHIKSGKTENVYNTDLRRYFIIEVGKKYIFNPHNPTNKKDRKNKGRIVEILGYSSDYWGDPIVRYLDNGRRGRLCKNYLVPIEEQIIFDKILKYKDIFTMSNDNILKYFQNIFPEKKLFKISEDWRKDKNKHLEGKGFFGDIIIGLQ